MKCRGVWPCPCSNNMALLSAPANTCAEQKPATSSPFQGTLVQYNIICRASEYAVSCHQPSTAGSNFKLVVKNKSQSGTAGLSCDHLDTTGVSVYICEYHPVHETMQLIDTCPVMLPAACKSQCSIDIEMQILAYKALKGVSRWFYPHNM